MYLSAPELPRVHVARELSVLVLQLKTPVVEQDLVPYSIFYCLRTVIKIDFMDRLNVSVEVQH